MSKNICDHKVFKSLYMEYVEEIQLYIYYKYGDYDMAKDHTQEAFIAMWNNCKSIVFNKARAFLYKVSNNRSLNTLKHKKVVLKYQTTPSKNYTNESPEFVLEEKQYMDRLSKAIMQLTEKERIAFMLNRVHGKKHKEIAVMLGISQKGVEKRIYNALQKLRKEIKEL